MKLTMLGTGNALVTECYNTCFVIEDNNELFMVDGGGGSNILSQLKKADYNFLNIHHIFVTHKHIDHLLGIIWMIRVICSNITKGKYKGDCYIYSHGEVLELLNDMAEKLLVKKEISCIGERLHFVKIEDGDSLNIIHHKVTFFDIKSTKAKQFGFVMETDGDKKLVCCGDEPLNKELEYLGKDAEWMLHEAFCLDGEADIFGPYEKHHSTVKDACMLAEKLNVKNLVLYHTEDKNIVERKRIYSMEGKEYYHGNLYIPDDLEVIEL